MHIAFKQFMTAILFQSVDSQLASNVEAKLRWIEKEWKRNKQAGNLLHA